jgi:two-component system sensor histidine kinase CpxA
MFFRLFLSFMTIMVVTGIVGFFLFHTLHQAGLQTLRNGDTFGFENRFSKVILLSGEAAYKIYIHEGVDQYARYVAELNAFTKTHIRIIGPDNRTLLGEKLNDDFLPLVQQAKENYQNSVFREGRGQIRVAKQLTESYVLLGTHVMGPPPEFAGPPFQIINQFIKPFRERDLFRILVTFAVASAVCYLLARSLTAPVRKLRAITQRFADGDFSARVEQRLRGGGSELEDLGGDFNIMAERIEGLICSQKRLLRDISHELRSPLARLNVALELARTCDDTDKMAKLDIIEKESGRLNELIGQLLKLTELQDAGEPTVTESVNVTQLLQDIVEDAAFEASFYERSIRIISIETVTICGCEELLRRAIENVVRNAIRYTGGNNEVEVSLNLSGGNILISVRDHGEGVPEDELKNIFEPFYRTENARERGKGGSGLGLAIARQAVQLHKGQISGYNCNPGFMVVLSLPA